MLTLIATLPTDRAQTGTLQVILNGATMESFPCLGKADNDMARRKGNPSRNPERPYGDTPTGTWTVRVGITKREQDVYGKHPVLMLWPTGGQAMKAYNIGRRSGIWIHGGEPSATGGLRPTYGCIRVLDETMARLHELIRQHGQIETLETKEA